MNAISVQDVSKEFTLSAHRRGYRTFKETIAGGWRSAGKPFRALNDVSFDVAPGEAIGIIGSNGAGKSTLLKILARILRPTAGRIELEGRVGSLLEVGAGFHPDLTGRENIFLNAAILGMGHGEILQKLDAIVAFAGFEKHLDEPVKHYSSGMYMRLAFAVAAHIEPEILLLDEVLAVGDADFQKKCLGRLEQAGRGGQTVVFVSHNMHAITRLCSRAILLEGGRIVATGPARDVVARYLESGGGNCAERRYSDGPHAPGDQVVRLRAVRIRAREGETLVSIDIGREFGVEIEFDVQAQGKTLFPAIILNNEWGPVLWSTDVATVGHAKPRPAGRYTATAWFPADLISPGAMSVTVDLYSFQPHTLHFHEPDAVSFHATETHGGSRGGFLAHIDGGVRPRLEWTVEYTDRDDALRPGGAGA
jgi:lipopolysaccharide transport system ATP-binding protein